MGTASHVPGKREEATWSTSWTLPLVGLSVMGSEAREVPRAEPGRVSPSPCEAPLCSPSDHRAPELGGLFPVRPPVMPPLPLLTSPKTDLQTVSPTSHPQKWTREPASKRGRSRRGHVATLRPGGRALGAKPRPRRPGRQLGAGGTGGGGRGEVPTCSWWLSREQGDKVRLANTEAAAPWDPWLLQMVP